VARAAVDNKPLSERTLVAYDEIWRQYLAPALGKRPLNAITRPI
jgi:hypothetical protein